MKKKICKKCKLFVKEDECPICKGNQFATVWQGRINVIDATKSSVAKHLIMEHNGEYAVKIR